MHSKTWRRFKVLKAKSTPRGADALLLGLLALAASAMGVFLTQVFFGLLL